ncbi:hypothetical protein [Streptomyces sp. NPDC097610]|uniref:hypothetical protein n=1 Tax=Streptomyces sp. NPDC097610 TaxID=3157227 RepID=UPI00332A51DE
MSPVDATFYPLIITGRDHSLFRQPPQGTDMGALRIVPATEVRPGDWVLGEYEGALDSLRLHTVMQSCACFPALPAAVNGMVALDGESLVWEAAELVLVILRECIPAGTYGDRSTGYRVGDRVERSMIYEPIHDDHRDKIGVPRPVIQRGTVEAVEDGVPVVEWDGRWVNGRTAETAMRLVDPARVDQERRTYGLAVGDTVAGDNAAEGVVLEMWLHWYDGTPMARVYWPGSPWSNYCRYDFAEARRFSRAMPAHAA